MRLLLILVIFSFFTLPAYPRSVVLIGDSHSVGHFGIELDRLLRLDEANKVATYAACGATPEWYYTGQVIHCGWFFRTSIGQRFTGTHLEKEKTPLIYKILEKNNPDIVIVQMGGNFVTDLDENFMLSNIKKMIKTIKDAGASCLWVGTPDMRYYRSRVVPGTAETQLDWITRITKKAVADSCAWVDGRDHTHYPNTGGDGVHYWGNAALEAKIWAKAVFDKFNSL